MKHCRYVGMFFEARAGVMVDKFIDELIAFVQESDADVVGMHNDRVMKINRATTADDAWRQWNSQDRSKP